MLPDLFQTSEESSTNASNIVAAAERFFIVHFQPFINLPSDTLELVTQAIRLFPGGCSTPQPRPALGSFLGAFRSL